MRQFYPHQRKAFRYAKPKPSIALLMQMRLGKSLVATRWAKSRTDWNDPVLIITPATTMHVWQSELEAEGINATLLQGSSKKKLAALWEGIGGDEFLWFVVNPEGVRACPEILTGVPWEVVIVDESGGWFTNPAAKTVKLIRRSLGEVPNRAILTGLPDPAGPEDYFEQMAFTFGEFMGHDSFWKWRLDYMRPAYFGWELKPSSRRKIKSAVRELAFIQTAKEAGVYVPKVYESRYVELPAPWRTLYRQAIKDFELGQLETKWAVVVQTWLAMLAGGIMPVELGEEVSRHKIEELVKLLKGELRGTPIVIWARFIRELQAIRSALKKAGVKVEILSGLTKKAARPKLLDDFRRGKVDALAIQPKIGQYALNLAHASAHVFYSNEWDWGIRGQCEKRSDHVEKKEAVLIVDLVTENTVDEDVLAALRGKRVSSNQILQRAMARVKNDCLR